MKWSCLRINNPAPPPLTGCESQGNGGGHGASHPLFTLRTHFTEMCCGAEAGSYLRPIDSFITQLKAQGPSRTCNESKGEEKKSGISSAEHACRLSHFPDVIDSGPTRREDALFWDRPRVVYHRAYFSIRMKSSYSGSCYNMGPLPPFQA